MPETQKGVFLMAQPATVHGVKHIDDAFTLLADALTPAELEHRDDLTEFFELRAERTDENDHVLIRVDAVVALLLDNTELAALMQAATPRKEQ